MTVKPVPPFTPSTPSIVKQSPKPTPDTESKAEGKRRPQPPRDKNVTSQVPVPALGASLLSQYDTNRDGGISVGSESTKFVGDRTTGRTYSIDHLAQDADAGGYRNGVASEEEINAVVQSFDTGPAAGAKLIKGQTRPVAGDGILTGSELDAFNAEYGPQVGASFIEQIRDKFEQYDHRKQLEDVLD